LGEPILTPAAIPIGDTTGDSFIGREANIGGSKIKLSAVGMGNPHCVIFDSNFDETSFAPRADKLQSDKFFPEGVNVEFVQVVSNKHLRVVVYERGCGRTLACASGAAATVVAAVLEGKTSRDVRVELEGGSLQISWNEADNHLRINGGATLVYDGLIQLSQIMPEAAQW
jgi:diaminopimelate epimerase